MESLIKDYVETSWELNMILCGKKENIDTKYSVWTDEKVKIFINVVGKAGEVLYAPLTLYRGSGETISPTMQEFNPELTNCQFLSTTSDKNIALEFVSRGKKERVGYLHILKCEPGVKIIDISNMSQSSREKETLIYPGCRLTLISFEAIDVFSKLRKDGLKVKTWKLEWLVSPK